MKLYLVRGNDVDGENQDLVVVAETPVRAKDIWNDYLVEQGWPRDCNDRDQELPRTQTFDPASIREILPDVAGTKFDGPERAIDWEQVPDKLTD